MRWLLAAVLFGACLLPLLSLRETSGQFGGTFIGAIVAEDGVVIGADSRSTFLDASGKRLGYVDRMQKIYVDHGAAVAVSGLVSVEDELFNSFMNRNSHLLARPVHEILFDLALKLPSRNTANVLLLSAGYVNGEPTICAKSPADAQSCRKAGYVASKTSGSLRRWSEARRGRVPSLAEAAAALEQAIQETADLDPAVGGPITLLVVPKTGAPRWLKNPPESNGWNRICDVVASHRTGRTTIFFTNTKDELDRYLNGACPVTK
jgi:20S proteasome alpha/beta subunit